MKNLPLIFIGLTLIVNAQPWQQNDIIFNPSGIPSLTFSQPRFADVDSDNDFDLILGSTSDKPLFFENTGSAANPSLQSGTDIFLLSLLLMLKWASFMIWIMMVTWILFAVALPG